MGSLLGRAAAAPHGDQSTEATKAPEWTPDAVNRLYQEAYAAGAEDAGCHYMQLVESTRRQDLAVGVLACSVVLWFTLTYGNVRVAREKTFAQEHLEAQKALLVASHEDLSRAESRIKTLTTGIGHRDSLLDRQRRALARLARQQRSTAARAQRERCRSAAMQREVAVLQRSVVDLHGKLCLLGTVCALAWVGTTWCLWRQKHRGRRWGNEHVEADRQSG